MREPVDPLWQQVHRALLNRIAYRDRDYMQLHDDYCDLEFRYNALLGVIRRQARRDRFERAQAEAKAANDN